MKPTLDRIIALVAEFGYFDTKELSAETRFIEDIGFDSLDMVEVVMAVEDEYDIVLSDDEAYGVVTIQDLLNTATRLHEQGT